MLPGLIHDNAFDYFTSLLIDIIVFTLKSIYYLIETIYLTLLPKRLRKLKNVSGQIVLITGGAGGVGRKLALNFAKLRARIVIWDINKEAIHSACEMLREQGFDCSGYVVDIADRLKVYEAAQKLQEEIGTVDILINNAGMVTCRPFLELSDKAIEATYNVNILSHYWTTKAFLPEMIKQKRGHIVTVSSVTGLMGTYACTDYAATKFACIGFHESLFTELRSHGHEYIGMTLVCPYYINTGMFHGVKPRLLPMLEPEYVADRIVDATLKNEVNCTLPNSVRLMMPLKHLLPAKTCWEMMSRIMRGPMSMAMYKTRGKAQSG